VDSPSSHLKDFETLLSFHLKIELKVECSRGFYLLLNYSRYVDWKFYFFETIVDLIFLNYVVFPNKKDTLKLDLQSFQFFNTKNTFFYSSFI
jgi:hypothetical protein